MKSLSLVTQEVVISFCPVRSLKMMIELSTTFEGHVSCLATLASEAGMSPDTNRFVYASVYYTCYEMWGSSTDAEQFGVILTTRRSPWGYSYPLDILDEDGNSQFLNKDSDSKL